jgi:SAM-dependent methyltransferase
VAKVWRSPIYTFGSGSKSIVIDVTSSISASLPPNKVITEKIIPFFKARKVRRILDFGAGALRHTFPLLDAGFEVCSVEFNEAFTRETGGEALAQARKHPNFCELIWPSDFIADDRKFGAALLCYVLQVMPVPAERRAVLKHIYRKLRADSYLLYMSRFGQITPDDLQRRVSDGYYRWPDRAQHSFYCEFKSDKTHEMMNDFGFARLRSLSERGTDQVYLYGKGSATFV